MLRCWYCEVETLERDKAAHLCWRCDPRVPDRYKSIHAGQHSSEQVNRASSNPSGGPQSARAQQRLLQMLTSANSLAFRKTKLVSWSYARRLRLLFLLQAHVPTSATNWTIWCQHGIHPTDAVSHLTNVALYKRVKYLKRSIVISGFSMNVGCQEMQVISLRAMESL